MKKYLRYWKSVLYGLATTLLTIAAFIAQSNLHSLFGVLAYAAAMILIPFLAVMFIHKAFHPDGASLRSAISKKSPPK